MPTQRPRNLLFLLSDNHARSVIGCYGNRAAVTPNIDGLATRGVRFTQAQTASPICCPARAALATGRYPHRTGYWDNAIVYDGRIPSWMHALRHAGHDVVSVGKLHFRSSDDDNGFSREIAPMHILNGKGGVSMLLRWSGEEPVNRGQWELYFEQSGIGETGYQRYDRAITEQSIDWLKNEAGKSGKPWALFVSYVSAHPPFTVPQRLYDLYKDKDLSLPPLFRPEERPDHPAVAHLRHQMDTREIRDEARLLDIQRCYLALSTHLDEQIGAVLKALDELGLTDDTLIIYSTDHGESVGAHGLMGKSHLYEPAIGVPLIMAGADLPQGHVVDEPVSHVDLYPTIVEGAGLAPPDSPDLDGESLWPIISGARRRRPPLAEYHAAGSRNAGFVLRDGALKLIYHVGAPAQLFDLAADPNEGHDLAGTPAGHAAAAALEAKLRAICDPEEVDRRAKADQQAKAEFWGGNAAILEAGLIVYTPPPALAFEPAADDGPP
ncbi:sulfatase-like hydrolase/transferase [Vineibacter terrae]|uniref:sulfatase-like hydrolase/transferase n=1 Tax=Vineibacter terrae TaxID=2586908 RepID=UPI002E330FB8|nr:sulfatase-like hydrolase/transferase [Vineibacter terrae]HEX2885204.1 sulfatase-like hydrolase/transferase [Vineibacter terrae]